jgi:CRISPR-associated protein Csh2
MSETIKNRGEILFLYDVKDNNPNGDPLDGNKPRIDEETSINIVTDVRLKRTVRDYLLNFRGKEIFVREIADNEGKIQDAKMRASDFLKNINVEEKGFNEQKEIIKKAILESCIDVKLFGATIPLDLKVTDEKSKPKSVTGSITLTGPVQFRMGRSLNKVELKYIKGTGAFASREGTTQKTFREEYILPYSLIAFYGIINENAAKETELTENDVSLLLEGLWIGTKNLISRSKAGHEPRLLLKVNYKEHNYHVGDLDKLVKIELDNNKRDEEIRDIGEVKLNADKLVNKLIIVKESIENIQYKIDDRVQTDLIDNLKAEFGDKLIEINW